MMLFLWISDTIRHRNLSDMELDDESLPDEMLHKCFRTGLDVFKGFKQ